MFLKRSITFTHTVVLSMHKSTLVITSNNNNLTSLPLVPKRCALARRYCSTNMEKPKVYVTRQINKEALNALQEKCHVTVWHEEGPVPRGELLKNIRDKDGLFCMLTDIIDKDVLDECPSLKVIATMSAGYDHLQIDEIKKRNIKIGYTPNILTDATAELAVALLLATSRRLIEASQEAKTGGWKAWAPFWMCGPGLAGSTVGIVGFGRIGQAIAKCLKGFNVKSLIFHNRSDKSATGKEIGATQVSFDKLITSSDFIIASCALSPQTQGIFNKDTFSKMKRSAVFVNISRGAVVNQDDLISALQNNLIMGAGLDVMTPEPLPLDSPLLKLKNCVVLPHIGSASINTRNEMAMLTVRNIICALNGDKMPAELIV